MTPYLKEPGPIASDFFFSNFQRFWYQKKACIFLITPIEFYSWKWPFFLTERLPFFIKTPFLYKIIILVSHQNACWVLSAHPWHFHIWVPPPPVLTYPRGDTISSLPVLRHWIFHVSQDCFCSGLCLSFQTFQKLSATFATSSKHRF